MKYQIEEYKDHFKIAEQITVPCVVTPKWYQFWKSATTTEHEVWAHMRRASDSLLNEFLSGSELKFKTKEKAQKHIDNLIKKSNEPKVKYPIIHEVADNESCSSSVSFKLSVLTPCTESDAERIKLALNIDDNALTDLIFSASVFGVRPDQIINSVLNGREGLKKHFTPVPIGIIASAEPTDQEAMDFLTKQIKDKFKKTSPIKEGTTKSNTKKHDNLEGRKSPPPPPPIRVMKEGKTPRKPKLPQDR